MSEPLFAVLFATGLALLHLQQVNMLSGSLREYWTRTDAKGRTSKLFFALSLCSCLLIAFVPIIGMAFALAFIGLSLGFSMQEWKG
jgi:hypothetical protein